MTNWALVGAFTRRTALAVLGSSALLASCMPDVAMDADLEGLADEVSTEVHRILAETTIPAISISAVRGGEVVWSQGFGTANVSTGAPATTDTYFSTGSTLKPVTAVALVQLVDEGALSLDDRFNELVGPGLAVEGADEVTLRHLLTHHAGLEGPVDIVPLWGREALKSPEQTIREVRQVGPAGVEYAYCNVCYTMVGYVVEVASGVPFDEYMALRILQPLGSELDAATLPSPEAIEALALPYGEEDNKAIPIEQIRTNVFAAGDAYLRARDMAAFLATVLNEGVYEGQRLVSERSVAEILTPHFDSPGSTLGFNRGELDGRVIVSKNGIFTGYHSHMIGDPVTGHGAYVVANSTTAGAVVASLARLVLHVLWEVDQASASGPG